MTGQYASLDAGLSAEENLRVLGRLLGLSRRAAQRRASELLAQFEPTEVARRAARALSGGTRRRLDLAATLITAPALIFLDEPTTGLDPHTRNCMWESLRALVEQGVTILLTTQYLEEADALADRIAVIDRGAIIAHGTPEELKSLVGEDSLSLRLVDPARVPDAVSTAERISGAVPRVSAEDLSLTVPLRTVELATTILIEFQRSGIRLRGFGVDRPDLNEVFFALTGHTPLPGAAR